MLLCMSIEKYVVPETIFSAVNSWFKKVHFPFLHQELFDLRKIYVVNLRTGRPKKTLYVCEFATWDLS